MRLLLDTNIFLWFSTHHPRYTKSMESKILNASEVYVSSGSIWEAAIKIRLKKLHADVAELVDIITKSGLIQLPITVPHAALVRHLPDIHQDPFDRLLIAQTISESLTFLTSDAKLKKYSHLVEVFE